MSSPSPAGASTTLEPLAWLPRRLVTTTHPTLAPGVVLAAKALSVCWLVSGMAAGFPRPVGPWLQVLDGLPAWWPQALAALSVTAALGLLLTPATRRFAAAQALVIALGLLAARGAFAHHRLFAMSFFLAVAGGGALARVQVAVLYAGAALDKLRAPGWPSGAVLRTLTQELSSFGALWRPWGHVGEPLPWLGRWLASVVGPEGWAHVSWGVIGLEAVLSVAFALGSPWALVAAAALHAGIFSLTGGTLGVFVPAGVATALVVLPRESVNARVSAACLGLAAVLASPLASSEAYVALAVASGAGVAWRLLARRTRELR